MIRTWGNRQLGVPAAALAAFVAPVLILAAVSGNRAPEPPAPPLLILPAPSPHDVRPMFGSGFDDPAVPEVVAGSPGDAPVLVGIVGRLPDAAVALVRDAAEHSRTVAIGESVEGWRLEGLAADQAVFARRGERLRVRLAPVEDATTDQ